MKLEAVVEQLQKQQQQQPAVQMDSRERRERQLREAQVPFPQQLAVQRAVLAASSRAPAASPGAPLARAPPPAGAARAFDQSSMNSEPDDEEEEEEEEEEEDDEEEEEEEGGLEGSELDGADVTGKESCSALKYFRAPKVAHPNQRVASTSNPLPAPGHQRGGQQGKEEQGKDTTKQLHSGSPAGRPNWRLDEQLKQNGSVTWSDDGDGCRGREISRDFAKLYELDSDPERKEFLDDLFIFMQKRGTPINRIPIMAKQILDLYMLYKLVTEKGGLVEIINKKIWREITKGLNLPTSITSAAFTLRTQYMKYLYAYECEKKSLSSPAELQAAIDGNRREGRRPSYSSSLFSYSPTTTGPPSLLSPPKIRFPIIGVAPGSGTSNPRVSPAAAIRKGDGVPLTVSMPNRIAVPVTLSSQQATVAARTATLEQLRERLESGEPPEKKVSRTTEEEQRLVQQALQRNLFSMARQIPMKIKINGKEDKPDSAAALNLSPNGIGSINMSVEINGTTYAGVLFAQKPVVHLLAGSGTHSSCSSSSSSHCSPSPTSSRGTPSTEPSTSWSL
ncbi:AT-rich interactive domain-containing protein 3B isoform X1 [Neopelma chrysocephalum]|uniref:AT-rich interactive domain-containing protein 3B isoform X1 n=1 Tax=Neopelma chrysocephalum TaxID=114329 RepID=UPI000FCD0A72|nr:AT-rich interactive domain-containing protein 3B isoform X1 [Neopelma chrysocephalum]XP_027553794.1 AT-rich interactive domain-containing protein 3B isoform X1 [Neopelma chrysocephalum]XP_027553795.1 AT-rich interactive domain-containing protein 3B isoform X1 [Neopelma chrysocephalum]